MLVLVADDDRAVREALERALQLNGFDVALAADGNEALAAATDRTPDALVLDVMMPGYDGLDVTRRLRREGNRVPILLLTARDVRADPRNCCFTGYCPGGTHCGIYCRCQKKGY